MVNTTSQGEQFPPQGTGTIGANSIDATTETPGAQAIPTFGSMALNNSTKMPIMVVEDYERWQRTKTERNWRKEIQLLKVYPKPGESLLGFIVHCYKYGTECLMCPRCEAVYNRELAEAFERIPSNQGWNGHEGNPNMYIFDKRGVPMRQDSPHPRAKRVMFKLPEEVPEDKWTQAGSKKGKWRSFEDGGRTSWAYRK
ncbi:hypothetical protein KIW84_034977 [Lathyrus oleraceus]|uniref:Uncharacterized protein n=1 Tax=Pisum sativum TaxID=3888 RepID=A0A9D4Y4U6_PEA|nr:hypothetical protein KIW84_034977 [Pisum sativum]